jgi:hypothetical protein
VTIRLLSRVVLVGLSVGAAVPGCGGSATTSLTSPTTASPRCQPSLDVSSRSFGPEGGTGSVSVTIAAECPWSASSAVGWASITSPAQGQGAGSISLRIDSNPDPAPRAGTVRVNDDRVDLTQQAAPCRFDVSRIDTPIASGGGVSHVDVRTHDACAWSAASEVPWASLSTSSGRGAGRVTVTVAANAGAARSGAIVVAGERVVVTQDAATAPPPAPPAPPAPAPTPTPPTPPAPPAPAPPAPPPPAPPDDVELSGRALLVLGECPRLRFFLSGTLVVTNAQTDFKNGSCGRLDNNDRVDVKGRRQADGSVLATEVELRR